VEAVFACAILFGATQSFQFLLNVRAEDDGSPLVQALWGCIYLIVALRAVPLYRQIVTLLRANRFIVLLVLFAIMSTAWSQDPSLTFRRGIALLGTTLIGIDLAVRYSIREQLRLLCVVLGLFVLLSIIVQVFFPGLVPNVNFDTGAWHGIVDFKGKFCKADRSCDSGNALPNPAVT
jgi:exopolysaccharide production protein ExoQ